MYLKSLKLVGFKSFADRTTLEFRPGVTVIVGPNGSGKSNLVDALSWVMGAQSPKSLRTGRMEDVVFAGTATRPALNRAEVSLVIDNEGRRLPLDLDEVAITRRLYRDGSSDYEINNVACRLLDIEELLSDSGVGRRQHVIIGQGEIGVVLNATPEEHRAVVEEAAGILKHRRRKEKAERRLERTDDDLVRLQDLVSEVERQLRPLRRQASAAERYDDLKDEVRGLVLYLARVTLQSYEEELERITMEKEALLGETSLAETRVRQVSGDLERMTGLAASIRSDLDRDSGAAARLETTIERLRRLGSVAHERIRAASGRASGLTERRSDLEEELAVIAVELADLSSSEIGAAAAVARAESRFRTLEEEERAVATQAALAPEGAAASVRGESGALEAANERDARELATTEKRIEVVGAQMSEESMEIERINDEIRSTDERQSGLQAAYDAASLLRAGDQARWSAAEESLNAARLEHVTAEARLEAAAAALQGTFDSETRRIVETSPGSLGSLLSLLEVPPGLERAVSAALGVWAGSVAFADPAELSGSVEMVKSSGSGGISVVSAGAADDGPDATAVARDAGVESLVDSLAPGPNARLARRLLGDVLLVEGWKTAWDLVRRHPGLRAVTPEGDLITIDGVDIAHPDDVGRAMLETAESALETARTGLARALSIGTAAKREFDNSREAERAALEALETVEASLAGKTEAMARLQKSQDGLGEELARLVDRRSSLVEEIEERLARVETLRIRLADLEGEEASRVRAWEEIEGKRRQLAEERESARSEWEASARRSQAIIERRKLLEERSTRITVDLTRMGEPSHPTDSHGLALVETHAAQAVEALVSRLVQLRDRQAGLRKRQEEVLAGLRRAGEEHDSGVALLDRGRERLGRIEIRLTELRLLKESLAERVSRDAAADIEEAREAPRPDHPVTADLEAILEERSIRLRRLGPINPHARAEYRELSERHGFLTAQLADVESSRAELRKVIKALEAEIDERFEAAFSEVATAYQRYFSLLFPGGRGRIRLTEPDDPHSGLRIEAQPVGKKVSQMSLLSGGEKSLAALAFLFSIFEARPSPFYILDEVEAALDDANLRRFLRILTEFRHKAQVVIITHQQQTMEVADVLYGVTMEPGGSSQTIRKDMARMGADRVA